MNETDRDRRTNNNTDEEKQRYIENSRGKDGVTMRSSLTHRGRDKGSDRG